MGVVVLWGNCPTNRGSCPIGVIVLQVNYPCGSCPQGSCPRGSCSRGSCPKTQMYRFVCLLVFGEILKLGNTGS